MKWGIRKDDHIRRTSYGRQRYKDEVNSRNRTIKKGTELQTITKGEYDPKRTKRLYTSYTDYDKDSYIDLMANYQYGGEGYKNTFVVKKDLKVASDKEVVDTFVKIAKDNPKQVAKDMAKAYNDVSLFFTRTEKVYSKKLSELDDDKKAKKLAEEFVKKALVSTKVKDSSNNFYGHLVEKGFDAISDTNDRKGGAQDPLIILNLNSIKQKGSIKLTDEDLEHYFRYTMSEEHTKRVENLSQIQR